MVVMGVRVRVEVWIEMVLELAWCCLLLLLAELLRVGQPTGRRLARRLLRIQVGALRLVAIKGGMLL